MLQTLESTARLSDSAKTHRNESRARNEAMALSGCPAVGHHLRHSRKGTKLVLCRWLLLGEGSSLLSPPVLHRATWHRAATVQGSEGIFPLAGPGHDSSDMGHSYLGWLQGRYL